MSLSINQRARSTSFSLAMISAKLSEKRMVVLVAQGRQPLSSHAFCGGGGGNLFRIGYLLTCGSNTESE